MEETLNTFTRKTKLYYLLQIGSIGFIVSLFITYKYHLQGPKSLMIILLILGLALVVANMILTATNVVPMYIVDGVITLSPTEIKINAISLSLPDLKRIEIGIKDYKGAKASDGSGNRIEITDKNNKLSSYRFVIESKDQQQTLKQIVDQWNANGLSVKTIVF